MISSHPTCGRSLAILATIALAGCSDGQLVSDFIEPPPPKALVLALGSATRSVAIPYGSPEATIDSITLGLSGRGADTARWTGRSRAPWIQLLDSTGVGSGVMRWRRAAPGYSPGVYIDTIRIDAPGAIGSPTSVIDTLVVAPAAPTAFRVSLTPASRFVRTTIGQVSLVDSAIVEQAGSLSATVPWFAGKRAPWTSLLTSEGTGSGTVRWSRDVRHLQPGFYVDTISVMAAGIERTLIDSVQVRPPVLPPRIFLSLESTRDSVPVGTAAESIDSVGIFIDGSEPDAEWLVENVRPTNRILTALGAGAGQVRFARMPNGLDAGVYVDTIWVSLKVNRTNRRPIVDTLKVGPVPEPLALSLISNGASRYKGAPVGSSLVFRDSVKVLLGGDGAKNADWTASKVSPTTTLLIAGGRGSAYAKWTRSSSARAVGRYVDTIQITAPGALRSPGFVMDTLEILPVAAPIRIALVPTSRVLTSRVGVGSLAADSAAVQLTGAAADDAVWVATNTKSWLRLTQYNGTGPGLVRYVRNPAGLTVGTYVDTVTVRHGALAATLVDSLIVSTEPPPPPPPPPSDSGRTAALTPPSSFDVAFAGAAPRNGSAQLTITGLGAADAPWSATKLKSWTTLAAASGTGSATLNYQRTVGSLVPGLYVDTITVTVAGATGSPVRLIDTLQVLAAADTTAGVGEAPSPTGRNPKLIWTKKRQFVWNRMRAENHVWWQLIKGNAERTGTASERSNDIGQWATLAYQITGDPSYGRRAWARVLTRLPITYGGNQIREQFSETVMMYDWLYPVLTPAERAQYVGELNKWADYALGQGGESNGIRLGDSDFTVGAYFGLAFMDLAIGAANPRGVSFLAGTDKQGTPIGGLTATGANRTSARNAVADFVRLAEGGEWIESTQYNPGTAILLLMGADGVRTATGVDHFPEVTRLGQQMAATYTYRISPDLNQYYQWGDNEQPRSFGNRLGRHVNLLGVLAGLNQGHSAGAAAQGMLSALVGKYGADGYQSAEPGSRLLYFYSPWASSVDWRGLPATHFASGVGVLASKNASSAFYAHAANIVGVDHQYHGMGSFQLYRNGEWAVTHPLGYGGIAEMAETGNTMLFAGLSAMRNRVVLEANTTGSWASVTTRNSGNFYPTSQFDPPPPFLQNWVRSLVHFREGGTDVIAVWDSVVVDDPKTLPKLARYRATDLAKINAAANVVEWQIHSPVAPQLAPGTVSWSTPGGQSVVVHTLAPAQQTRAVGNQAELWSSLNSVQPSERKFQVRLAKSVFSRHQVFLNVIAVGGAVSPELIPGGVRVGQTSIVFWAGGVTVTR